MGIRSVKSDYLSTPPLTVGLAGHIPVKLDIMGDHQYFE